MRPIFAGAAIVALSSVLAGPIEAQGNPSQFGCQGLETDRDLPSIEGKDGVFFRINADLRMNHPFSDNVVAQMAEFANALAEQGTTLIYVPIPTKSVTMPEHLPENAWLYGFDLDVATWVHVDILNRLNAAGVVTVDVREAMKQTPDGTLPFFKADFHWTAHGAAEAAKAIAEVFRALPGYAELDKTEHATVETGVETAFSGMRRILQKHCLETLPEAKTMTFDTQLASVTDIFGTADDASDDAGEDQGGGLDIFGADTAAIPVALIGTSFSDSPINNFPGFIAQYSELEVINYAITGGNQFGAMTSYLTSSEFQENRPRFIIWENPIYNNLAQYGDQPFGELIAAARKDCPITLATALSEDGRTLRAELSGDTPSGALFVDSDGSVGLEARFRFASAEGYTRTKTILRGERLRRTGRFYMPLSGLWPDGARAVEVELSQAFGPNPTLQLCDPQSEDKS